MADKQIHELTALPSTLTTGNVFAVDTGDATYKIDYDALAAAIIGKIGDPVALAHGGTGATSAAAALANLGALQLVRYTTNGTEFTLNITPSNTYKFALIFADYGGPTSQDRAALYSLTVANTGVKVEVLAGTNARSCEASIVNGAVKLTFGGTMWGGIAVLVFN